MCAGQARALGCWLTVRRPCLCPPPARCLPLWPHACRFCCCCCCGCCCCGRGPLPFHSGPFTRGPALSCCLAGPCRQAGHLLLLLLLPPTNRRMQRIRQPQHNPAQSGGRFQGAHRPDSSRWPRGSSRKPDADVCRPGHQCHVLGRCDAPGPCSRLPCGHHPGDKSAGGHYSRAVPRCTVLQHAALCCAAARRTVLC